MKPILAAAMLAVLSIFTMHSAFAGADAPVIRNSVIEVNVVAIGVVAQGIPGGTTTRKTWYGKKKTSTTSDMPAVVNVGGVEVLGNTEILNSRVAVNVVAAGLVANGATVNVGIARFSR